MYKHRVLNFHSIMTQSLYLIAMGYISASRGIPCCIPRAHGCSGPIRALQLVPGVAECNVFGNRMLISKGTSGVS